MRGATRIQVQLLLATSGALAGALVGFGAGLVPAPDVPALVAAAPAAALDALRVPAPSIRRQVPQYWGRVLPIRTVAVLYGTRLGIGPLTILPTWLWWAAMIVGVSRGPWAGAATGATFAIARVATMWIVGTRARRLDAADRSIRVAVAVVALAALAVGCSDDDDDAARSSSTSEMTTATIALEPTTTSTTTAEDTALDAQLLHDALPDFTLVADDVLDLDEAAKQEADVEAERALLETRGFVRGRARTWTDDVGEDVVLAVAYEMGSSEQAELYLVDGAETLTARGAARFDVPDVPGAFGFTTEEDDFIAHAVAFTSGPRWFLVLVGSATGTRTVDEVRSLAAAQAALVT